MQCMAEERIGMIIRRARERRRWTQRELAKAVGVSRATVDAWENDRSYPRNRVGALEEVLGISLSGTSGPAPDIPVRQPGPLDDLLPWQHDWERQVAEEEELPPDLRRRMITDWRNARSEARARRQRRQGGATATGAA